MADPDQFVEVAVDSIRVHVQTGQHVVILKDRAVDRYLPIWIGPYEANAIALKITGQKSERPITHDMVHRALVDFGIVVRRVVVASLTGEVFFARVHFDQHGTEVDVDSRASDAIALAVRFEAPIFIAREVMDTNAVMPDSSDESGETDVDLDEDRLAVFRDLVNSLDLPELPDEPGDRSTQS